MSVFSQKTRYFTKKHLLNPHFGAIIFLKAGVGTCPGADIKIKYLNMKGNIIMSDNQPTGAYRPLSPWAYFGLQILFSIPIVGFIFLIVFSLSNGNINRRNFARSYWCVLVIVLIIIGITLLIGATSGIGAKILEAIRS